jgi:branched-chain amino acid transport system ATP-binding protein
MIKVENLNVKYGGITAVRDVSFEVEEGKIIALIGNNGAGKTSTLKTTLRSSKKNAFHY